MADLQGIALGQNQNGRLELVATIATGLSPGSPGAVWRLQQLAEDDSAWTPHWRSLEVPITTGFGGPAMAANSDGRLEIAAASDGELLHAWQTAPNGDRWRHHSLGQPSGLRTLQESPALAQNRDGRLEVFMLVGEGIFSGSLWHAWQRTQGGWSPWAPLESPNHSGLGKPPVVAGNRDGRLEVFAEADGAVWHIWQRTQGGWSPWHSLESPNQVSVRRPVVARNRDGRLEAFVLGSDKAVWHIWQKAGGGWSGWASLESPPDGSLSELAAGAHADGRLVLFAVATPSGGTSPGDANALWQREQAVAGGWSPWRSFTRPYDTQTVEGPALALDANRRLHLWLRIPGGVTLYQLKQTEPNGSEWEAGWWEFLPPRPPSYKFTPAGSPPD